MRSLLTQGVIQIEAVHPELIRHEDNDLVGNAPRQPVMAADAFQPPDFVLVIEGDAVRFIGTVLL